MGQVFTNQVRTWSISQWKPLYKCYICYDNFSENFQTFKIIIIDAMFRVCYRIQNTNVHIPLQSRAKGKLGQTVSNTDGR